MSGQVFKDSYLKPAFHILRYTQIEESSVFWGRFAKLKILLKKILDISGLWVSKKFMKHIKPLIFPQMFKNCFNGSSANQVSLIRVICLIGWTILKQIRHEMIKDSKTISIQEMIYDKCYAYFWSNWSGNCEKASVWRLENINLRRLHSYRPVDTFFWHQWQNMKQ